MSKDMDSLHRGLRERVGQNLLPLFDRQESGSIAITRTSRLST